VPFEVPAVGQAKAEMLTLVRESLGMTQAEVAEKMAKLSEISSGTPVSQGYVSRAEKGRLTVSGERLGLYARALECVPELLCLDPRTADVGIGLIHHRKKAALSSPALRRIHGQLALTRLHVQSLFEASGAVPDGAGFLRVDVDDENPPYEAAMRVREAWELPAGPVGDLIAWIERVGGLVLLRDLQSDHLDAVSQWPAGQGPLLLVNARAPGDRLRFSIAHELGHLTMHRSPGSGVDQERQADEFAAAFLMPAADIREELAGGVDLARLLELKRRWRVSMGALLRRGQSLSAINDWQYRTITIEMSALGYRTAEPGVVEAEQPSAVRDAVERAIERSDMTGDDLARRMYLLPEDLRRDYAPDLALSDHPEGTPIHPEVRP
jgi:Zn-dependent peptidase ImmA (M78 family)